MSASDNVDQARLRTTLGTPALARLVEALRKRLELGRELQGRMRLPDATIEERRAVDELLGRPSTLGETLSIDLDAVAEALRVARICPDLTLAVTALCGPVIDRPAAIRAEMLVWDRIAQLANEALERWPSIRDWFAELARTGMLKRQAGGRPTAAAQLVREVALVCSALPAPAEPIARFAARLFGDAHALDAGTPRSALTVRAAARLGKTDFEDNAEGRRMAWSGVGVLCDELSTPVLALNLPAAGETALGRMLRGTCADSEPAHITLRSLLRWPLSTDAAFAGRDVFVCENPSIVALAAERVGRGCAPLVCLNGQFATPALVLLRQLRSAGARLRYHGDFDPAGLLIARRVMTEGAALPWRFNSVDYLAAPKGNPWIGTPPPTPWDPWLAEAMRSDGRAVHEEAVFETLAPDLVPATPR